MFSSTYIPNMKAFPFFIPEKKRQIGFQTKISVTHRFSCFTSCQPHPFYRGKLVRIQQHQLSQLQLLVASLAEGTAPQQYWVGGGRSERHNQLSARLAGVPQRFQLLPQWLAIGLSRLYGKLPWWCSPYRFKRSSNFMPRAFTLLAWADVRVGFPSTLMRVVAPSAPSTAFCATVGIIWRGLIGYWQVKGCNTFSMAKTSGKAQCAPYYKNIITYSTSVYYYYKSLPSKSLTITFMWRLPIPRDAPWRISTLISIITMLLLLLLLLFLLLLLLLYYCWASEASPTLGCSIEISRDICIYICRYVSYVKLTA